MFCVGVLCTKGIEKLKLFPTFWRNGVGVMGKGKQKTLGCFGADFGSLEFHAFCSLLLFFKVRWLLGKPGFLFYF